MRVIQLYHPLEGQVLTVLGWSHRHGQLHLLLVLPDGSRSLIPAAWTNLTEAPDKAPVATTGSHSALASINQLLHTRTIVDALLRRRGISDEVISHSGGEEWKGGATEPARTAAAQGHRGSLEHIRRQTKNDSDSELGALNRSGRDRRER